MTSCAHNGDVGPWAHQKLDCLKRYLEAYTTILRQQKGLRYYYVDAFAGPGRARIRELYRSHSDENFLFDYTPETKDEEEYIDGSPRVSLSIHHPFMGYLFIEKQQNRIETLSSELKADFPSLSNRIRICKGDANTEILSRIIDNQNMDWRRDRAVVFLDPYATELKWSTIEKLAHTGAIEIIVNNTLPMAVNRLIPRSGEIPETWRSRLNSYFGSEEWERIAYSSQQTLLGDQLTKNEQAANRLGRWYGERLKELFGHTAPPRIVRNTHGTPIYFLHWAGPNATGEKIAAHIMEQGEVL